MKDNQLNNIMKLMIKQISAIKKATEVAENEFVFIGTKLFSINSYSKTINLTSNAISERFQSGKIDSNINEIVAENKIIVEYLSDSLKNFELIESTIASINKLLEDSLTYLLIYDKIKMKLNMLSVLIRIESGWLGTLGEGFLSLSDSIINLSETISTEINNVKIEIASIIKYLDNANSMVKSITKNLKHSIAELNTNINNSTGLFAQEMVHKNHELDEIKLKINSIFSNISNVITLCQVQDATKQKLEHLIDNLPKLNEQVEYYDSENNYEFALKLIEKTLQIENNQLEVTKTTFVNSTIEIINTIQGISDMALSVKSRMNSIISTKNDKNNQNILEKIINEISPLANELSVNIQNSQGVFQLINNVISNLESIIKFIESINNISDEIDLLSINSIIKATKLGAQGAALAIISEQIKILSETSHDETQKITEQLEIVGSGAQKLSDIYNKSDQQNKFISVKTSLAKISNKLHTLEDENKTINETVKVLFDQINYLVDEIHNLGAKISVQKFFDKQLSEVINVFGNICYQIGSIKFTDDFHQLLQNNEFLNGMIKQYTMESERIIHQSHMKGTKHIVIDEPKNDEVMFFDDFENFDNFDSNNGSDNSVELFDEVPQTTVNSEDDVLFDDNIELF